MAEEIVDKAFAKKKKVKVREKEVKREDFLEIYKDINRRISERTSYGLREETIEKDSVIISWSNWSKAWGIGYPARIVFGKMVGYVVKKGSGVLLDANHVAVPYKGKIVEVLLPYLDPLPLYYLSREAKDRGEAPELETTLVWAIKQLEKEHYEPKR